MVKNVAKRFPLGDWSFLGPGEEENLMEGTITNLKDSLLQMSWQTISRTVDIQYSELPVRWIVDFRERKVNDVRFTSALNLRTQIFYLAQFFPQIRSVSTWQQRIGVMVNIIPEHGESRREGERSVLSKVGASLRWCRHLGRMFKQRETACSSWKMWRVVNWDTSISSFWICWTREQSLYRTYTSKPFTM